MPGSPPGMPGQQEVRNQARMHLRQPGASFASSLSAPQPLVGIPPASVRLLNDARSSGWPPRLCPQLVPWWVSPIHALSPGEPYLLTERVRRPREWQRIWPLTLWVNWP